MYEIRIVDSFSAAHRLRGYDGNCERTHGHNWTVEVAVRAATLDNLGLVIDFRDLKAALRLELAVLDHYDLGELEPFRDANPSTENIAAYLFRRLSAALNDGRVKVAWVRTAETPGNSCTYSED